MSESPKRNQQEPERSEEIEKPEIKDLEVSSEEGDRISGDDIVGGKTTTRTSETV